MKSVLITGCSSGIGYEAAIELRKRGYRVFATARAEDDVQRLCNMGLESHRLDLDCSRSIDQAVTWVLKQTGGELYALFNNGAYGQPGAVEDISRADLRAQFETNLFGWHELTCKLIPVMRRQGEGRIIQNSSVLGLITLKYRGAYNASKFALEGLTDTLRQELTGSGIHVSLIEPGPIESAFRKNAYEKFKQNINIEQSAHRDIYHAVQQRLEKQDASERDPFTLPPQAVIDKLIHALESNKPSPRYYVTTPTWLFGILRRLLSSRMLDRLLCAISDRENR